MADAEHDAMIAQFQGITGVDGERARFYLESAGWQVDLAMSSFYEADGEEASEPMDDAPEPAGAAHPPAPGHGHGKINFSAMADDDDSSDEEGEAYYAGGSATSGQQILGPPKKKKDKKRDIVGDMFKAARDAGAEEVEGGSGGQGPSRPSAFTGSGFKLGADNTASEAVAGKKVKAQPRAFVLKMWKDGFSIDDEDIRLFSDPANKEFLQSVMRGSIPPELVREANGGEVHVDMEDHRQEEFVKPKVKAKPFQGAGNVLGSIAPSMAPPKASASADPAAAEKAAAEAAKINADQPTTNVQVRLADGSRIVVKLNHSHTVGDLRVYITTARPQYAGVPFSLQTTFPTKEVTEDKQTLKEAGLLGAAILQRLK